MVKNSVSAQGGTTGAGNSLLLHGQTHSSDILANGGATNTVIVANTSPTKRLVQARKPSGGKGGTSTTTTKSNRQVAIGQLTKQTKLGSGHGSRVTTNANNTHTNNSHGHALMSPMLSKDSEAH